MNNFAFYSPTEFVFGKGTESQTAELVKKYKGTKVMIVYGGGSVVRSGLLDKVKKYLDEAGIAHVELGGIQPNPTDPKVYEGIELGRREGIDFLLPVGGGSVIDTAKAIAMGIPYEGDFWDFYMNKVVPEKAIPLGVVLTIPAAGSEGSGNTVITKLDGLKKLSVRTHGLLRPTFAVMNPELTYTLPAWQTACGVTDMMAHIMERYFTNTEDQEVPDRMCEGTLKAIITEALRVMKEPENYGARANLMWAATNALNVWIGQGVPQDWSSHRMGYALTAQFGLDHAQTLAILLPGVMTYMFKEKQVKLARMGEVVFGITDGTEEERARKAIVACEDFFCRMGLKTRLGECGIAEKDLDALAAPVDKQGWKLGEHHNIDSRVAREIMALRL